MSASSCEAMEQSPGTDRRKWFLLGLCVSMVPMVVTVPCYLGTSVSRHGAWWDRNMPGASCNGRLDRRGGMNVHGANSLPDSFTKTSILPGTFLYMVMGTERLESRHVKRSCLPNSMLLFLSYTTPIDIAQVKGICRAVSIFEPKTTWTTGRNRLREEAFRMEEQQRWKFEFFIFMDNDVVLKQNPATNRSKVYHGNLEPDEQFRQLLLRDRPLRASVKYGDVPVPPYTKTREPCVVSCFFDTIVDAYHRSGVDFVLPYDSRLDHVSWWMSAYMMNARFALAFPQYCSIYTQLNVDLSFSEHSHYPSAPLGDPIFPESLDMIRHELAEHHVPGFPWGMTREVFASVFDRFFHGDDVRRRCVRNAPGVNYSKDAYSPIFHYWLKSL